MMNNFCSVSEQWQIFLLILSLLTVIILTIGCIFGMKYRYHIKSGFGLLGTLILNLLLYVMMQIDSRLTGNNHTFHLSYIGVLFIILLSLGYAVWLIRHCTNNRKTINNASIKEAFDNLPTGVCFFNESGLPVLCNRAMQRFSFDVCGKDIQFITDLQECFLETFVPVKETSREGKIFTLADGSAWKLEMREVADEKGMVYTQFTALNVTDLQRKHTELMEENAQLKQMQLELKRLSANVVTITREEEILNTKMRVHDEMGKCLMKAQKYLKENSGESIPESVLIAWQRAVSMLKYNNDKTEEDMMSQIRRTCAAVNLNFIQKGKLPEKEGIAYILTCAVRECVTNAVRYAEASELYVEFTEDEKVFSVTISNNGKQPDGEIREGGGLSTLRRRVERAGGVMTVQSFPKFQLTVSVPNMMGGGAL